jgi:hypothetical protein
LFESLTREAIELAKENVEAFSASCNEFQFRSLWERLETFKSTPTDRVEQEAERVSARINSVDSTHQSAFNRQNDVIERIAELQFTMRTLQGCTRALPSQIIWAFPDIIAEFRWK